MTKEITKKTYNKNKPSFVFCHNYTRNTYMNFYEFNDNIFYCEFHNSFGFTYLKVSKDDFSKHFVDCYNFYLDFFKSFSLGGV